MIKLRGKGVTANDHLEFCHQIANAPVANNSHELEDEDISLLLKPNRRRKHFIQRTFPNLYFSDEENRFLDNLAANIPLLESPYKRSLAIAAACRACVKKRPRGVFTYVGLNKYDDGRRDLRMSLREHFVRAAIEYSMAV